MEQEHRTRVLDATATRVIPDDLDLWPAIQSRVVASHRSRPWGETLSPRVWSRRTLVGTAAAVALAVAAGAAYPLWSCPETASAQEILDRVQASATSAPTSITTYHLVQTRQVPGQRQRDDRHRNVVWRPRPPAERHPDE